ncbi:Histone acetyltransferase HPA2 [Caenispirillum salinarum AK4]|uniref:Histone acetyltransferase HPA2 n=1 Tax=Caenispirillum salinarum AK4 TaxID=1238182 RepID=K9GWP0_9PROT|nr:GNAT family N-acetyltransferase [Caenispirillum salinarum]EKV30425.1 Histone acetyltransferase HPA2 [Caenispirillum salinarum AK4]
MTRRATASASPSAVRPEPLIQVRDAEPFDEPGWRALWRDYVRFYEADVPERITAHTWARILDPASPVDCLVAVAPGGERVVGFAVTILHEGTWTDRPVCYLEDLYVVPDMRGKGVGRRLIETLACRGRSRGWHRLYWQTHHDNTEARALYDQLARLTRFVRYDLDL